VSAVSSLKKSPVREKYTIAPINAKTNIARTMNSILITFFDFFFC
jgi:hypothetical protein